MLKLIKKMNKLEKIGYIASTALFVILSVLYIGVLAISVCSNAVPMLSIAKWDWSQEGNYVGLIAGFLAYGVFLLFMIIPRMRHNVNWIMKFTHELTHTLVALLFFGKIREFVVRDRECYVSYQTGPIGYVPITLSPYCIPIYTFMLFPFRFFGNNEYMIIFDVLIAFTYAFHVHSFIRQTRFSQSDIENCGKARSFAFICFVHLAVLSLIMAIPRGGVMNALYRVFWEYPTGILS